MRAGAIREIQEEMGLNIKIVEELGVNEYIANDSKVEGGKKKKRVTYFLAESPFSDLKWGPPAASTTRSGSRLPRLVI